MPEKDAARAVDKPEDRRSAPASDGRKPGEDPWDPLFRHLLELREFAAHYLAARADAARLRWRRIVIRAALGMVALVAGGVGLATAVVLILSGAAQGLTLLFGGRAWLGSLVTGSAALLAAMFVVRFVIRKTIARGRRAAVQKYVRRRQAQYAAFGHDIGHTR